eukprot:gb/GEZN01009894.1/.p1 GENE.gb/GEZN01009894.1/~~gb/GEZN01009894.1/.p1  ORF type:complete len:336 (-),score=26.27 gb/GEZN01009894.1/:280-1230(-)
MNGEWLDCVVIDGLWGGPFVCGSLGCKIPLVRKNIDFFCPQHAAREDQCRVLSPQVCHATLRMRQDGKRSRVCVAHGFVEDNWEEGRPYFWRNNVRYRVSNYQGRIGGASRRRGGGGAGAAQDYGGQQQQGGNAGLQDIKVLWTHLRLFGYAFCVRPCLVCCGVTPMTTGESALELEGWLRVNLFPGRKPYLNVYDQACTIARGLLGDPVRLAEWEDSIWAVDDWHLRKGHDDGDMVCAGYCDWERYPELHGADGKCVFNTSAAEQHNAWVRGFSSLLSQWSVGNSLAYLTRLLIQRNRTLIERQEGRGKNPGRMQ